MPSIIDKFPKKRKLLPPQYADIYDSHYKSNRNGETVASSLSQRMESWLHLQVAKDASQNKSTLEIGAGTLNQLDYENPGAVYDIVEPFSALYSNSKHKDKIKNTYNLIDDVPIGKKYDRITSCAAFEHICDLPYVVSRAGLLLKDDGVLRTSVPNEGGFLWKIGYSLTTGLEFRLKHGLDYSVLMEHEHVNNITEITEVISYFFKGIEVKRLGVGKNFSLYSFILAQNPHLERCKEYQNEAL
ncbi:MAG: class I SAM-dependent methyltransferase [Defluviitaleaceae bacterium]|nr:class I SAM-dependent methyltransferase [Defluviitaleaceae bacterium]